MLLKLYVLINLLTRFASLFYAHNEKFRGNVRKKNNDLIASSKFIYLYDIYLTTKTELIYSLLLSLCIFLNVGKRDFFLNGMVWMEIDFTIKWREISGELNLRPGHNSFLAPLSFLLLYLFVKIVTWYIPIINYLQNCSSHSYHP